MAAPTIEHLRARWGERYRWIALATVMLGTIAAILTSTIVNVALPGLSADFEVGAERAQWVSSVHMAANTVAMLTTPWALARFGFRRVFFGSMAMLLVGSLGGGAAFNFGWLLAMRAVQGAAAGLLQPLTSVLILRAFGDQDRGRAMGVYGFGVVLAPAVGPSVGGLLVDAFGWRGVFLVAPPFALAAWLLAARLLPGMSLPPDRRRFDWPGFALLTAFVVMVVEGLVRLHDHGLLSPMMLGWIAMTLATGAAFLVWQGRADAPLVDLSVFATPAFGAGVAVAFIYGIGLFGSTLLVPLFVQGPLHFSASQAGLLLMPAGFALAVTMPVAGRLADRWDPALLVVAGLLVFFVSFALMAAWPLAGFWGLAAMLVLGRVGLGLILPSLSLCTIYAVPAEKAANASSVFNFARMLGGSLGTGALAIFVEARTGAGLRALDATPQALAAFREGFAVLGATFVIAAVVAWRLRGGDRAARKRRRQGPG